MDQSARLAGWMSEKGINVQELSDQLGYGINFIYKVLSGDRQASTNFQIRFINKFGREEAGKVFINSDLLALLEAAPA